MTGLEWLGSHFLRTCQTAVMFFRLLRSSLNMWLCVAVHPLCVLCGWEQHPAGEEITEEKLTKYQAEVCAATEGKPTPVDGGFYLNQVKQNLWNCAFYLWNAIRLSLSHNGDITFTVKSNPDFWLTKSEVKVPETRLQWNWTPGSICTSSTNEEQNPQKDRKTKQKIPMNVCSGWPNFSEPLIWSRAWSGLYLRAQLVCAGWFRYP